MKKSTIHDQIKELLNTIPEDSLEHVLAYLKEIQKTASDKVTLSHNLNKILEEDRNLLKRLAE